MFHSAATIKFDEDLTKAVNLNVVAVFTLIELCKKMKNLQVLIISIISISSSISARLLSTCPLPTVTHSYSIYLKKFTP